MRWELHFPFRLVLDYFRLDRSSGGHSFQWRRRKVLTNWFTRFEFHVQLYAVPRPTDKTWLSLINVVSALVRLSLQRIRELVAHYCNSVGPCET